MIESGTYYTVRCDECGERMDMYDEGGYQVFETTVQVADALKDRDWVEREGKHVCAGCVESEKMEAERGTDAADTEGG